ncbi:MAG: hypothetical protein ACT4QA_20725 [Panacagrimonas sp.]
MNLTIKLVAAALACTMLAACSKPESPQETSKDVAEEMAEGQKDIRNAEKDAMENQGDRMEANMSEASKAAADQYKIEVATADSTHAVAKEKCDAATGDTKDACQAQAKADHEAALAQAKSRRDSVAP